MKGLLLAGLLALLPTAARAQNWQANPVTEFCGLNTFNDATQIKDCDSPDAQNVITDTGGAEKRPGNTRLATILAGYSVKFANEFIAPSKTRYLIAHASTTVYETDLGSPTPIALSTVDTNGRIAMVPAYGKAIFQDGVGNPWYWDGNSTATLSGAPIGTYMQFADERLYVANIPSQSGSRVLVSSFGSINYFTVPGNVAAQPDAPNSFDFQKDDGESITCFRATPWGKVVGKKHSMNILKGYDNSTYYKRLIDPKVGCIDDRSMQMVDGLLIWLSYDGIYAWTGTGPPLLLSKDIESIIRLIRQVNSTAAEWILDTLGDFQGGTSSSNGPTPAWSATLVPASIVPSSATFVDLSTTNFLAGTFTQSTVAYVYVSTNIAPPGITYGLTVSSVQIASVSAAGFAVSSSPGVENAVFDFWTRASNQGASGASPLGHNGNLQIYTNADPVSLGYSECAGSPQGTFQWCKKYSIRDAHNSSNGANLSILNANTNALLYSSTQTVSAAGCAGNLCDMAHYWIDASTQSVPMKAIVAVKMTAPEADYLISNIFYSTSLPSGLFHWGLGSGNGSNGDNLIALDFPDPWFVATSTFVSRTFDTAIATPTFNGAPVYVSSSALSAVSFREQASLDGITWDATVAWTPGNMPASKKRYWRYEADFTTKIATQAAGLYELGTVVAIGTGTYDSPVHFFSNPWTTWKPFNATEAGLGGLLYYLRDSNTIFTANAVSPAWNLISNNASPTISTGSYVQWRVASTNVTISTDPAQVLRVAVNVQEGSDKPVASGFVNHRYFLCAEFSAASTENDKCLILQKNNKFIWWSGAAPASMGIFDSNLIVGDAAGGGYVWKIMQNGVYQDDGAAINAYWTSKQFTLDRPFQQKILHETWIDAAPVSSSTLTVGYAVDRASVFTSSTVAFGGNPSYVSKRIPLKVGFALGKYLQFNFLNSVLDQYFKLNDYMFLTETKDRTTE